MQDNGEFCHLYWAILYKNVFENIRAYLWWFEKYFFSKIPSFMTGTKADLKHTKTLTCYTCEYFTESNQHILRNLPPDWQICSMVSNIPNCLVNCFNLDNFQSVAFQNSCVKGEGKKIELRCKHCFSILRIKLGIRNATIGICIYFLT